MVRLTKGPGIHQFVSKFSSVLTQRNKNGLTDLSAGICYNLLPSNRLTYFRLLDHIEGMDLHPRHLRPNSHQDPVKMNSHY